MKDAKDRRAVARRQPMRTRAASLFAAVCLALGLTGCTMPGGVTGFDATLYVKGLVAEAYQGDYDAAFLRMVDSTQVEAEAVYQENLDIAYQYFCTRFAVDDGAISADTRALLQELIVQVYKGVRYQVHAAVNLENSEYAVKITVYPITVFSEILEDDYPACVKSFDKLYEDLTEETLAQMTPTERDRFMQEYEEAWAKQVAGLVQTRAGSIAHGPAEVMLVRVYPEDGGVYQISDRDMALLDELLIAYE